MVVDEVGRIGIQLDDLLVLFDRELEHVLSPALAARLDVAHRAQVDTPEELVSFEVIRVALNDVLSFQHGIPNASGLGIQLSQAGSQVRRTRVGINGLAVLFNRLVGQVAAPIYGHQLLVNMRHGVVVVGGGPVHLAAGSLGRLLRLRCKSRLLLGKSGRNCHQQHASEVKHSFHG